MNIYKKIGLSLSVSNIIACSVLLSIHTAPYMNASLIVVGVILLTVGYLEDKSHYE